MFIGQAKIIFSLKAVKDILNDFIRNAGGMAR